MTRCAHCHGTGIKPQLMPRGRWARYARALQADPGGWHTPLELGDVNHARKVFRRLKELGCEAVTESFGPVTATVRARWPNL